MCKFMSNRLRESLPALRATTREQGSFLIISYSSVYINYQSNESRFEAHKDSFSSTNMRAMFLTTPKLFLVNK